MLPKSQIKAFLVEKLKAGKVRTITENGITKELREP
jgi:hypothetical protein